MSGEISFLIKGNAGQLKQELAVASEAVKDFGDKSDKYMQKAGLSAKQLAFATRGLPAQFTDIATSLQAGQNPLTVFLQQGGQLKDMFGGLGPATKAMGGYIMGLLNPYTLAAAAAAGLGYAMYKSTQESGEHNKALILSGNTAGTTAIQMQAMAQAIAASSSASSGAASEAIDQFVRNGSIAADKIQGFASTAISMQKSTGVAVADTIKQFEELGKSPVEASLKLNQTTGYLTASVYEQIKALVDQGRTLEAGALAQKTYDDAMKSRMPQLEDNLLRIEKWWNAVAKAAKSAGASMKEALLTALNAGDPATMLRAQLATLQGRRAVLPGLVDGKEIAALKEKIAYYDHIASSNKDLAAFQASQNKQLAAGVALSKEADQYASKQVQMQRAIAKAQENFDNSGKSAFDVANYSQAVLGIQAKFKETEKSVKGTRAALDDAAKGVALYNDLMAVSTGLSANFAEKQGLLAAKFGKDSNMDQYRAGLTALIVQQPYMVDSLKAEATALAEIAKARDKALLSHATELESLGEKAQKIENEVALYGMSKDAIEALTTARMLARIDDIKDLNNSAEKIAQIREEIAARQRLAAAGTALDLRSAGTDQAKRLGIDAGASGALPDFTKQEDPFKDIGSTLRATFESAGTSLQKMTDAMGGLVMAGKSYAKEMQVVNTMKASKNPEIAAQGLKNENKLIEKNRDAQMTAFADLAGGAKGLFAEKTAAYKVLDGVEKAYHLMQLANMAEQLYTSLTTITIRAGAETAQTAFMLAEHAAASAADIALTGTTEATKNVAKAPGVIMSFMSWLGPWGMAAAAAAIGAVLGGAGKGYSGGAGGSFDKEAYGKTFNNGSGTVLGDATAQDQSIKNSLAILSDTARPELAYTSRMVTLLRSIDEGIASTTSAILLGNLDITGSNFVGSNGVKGGSWYGESTQTSTDLIGSGLKFTSQTIDQAINGLLVKKFSDVLTTTQVDTPWYNPFTSDHTDTSTSRTFTSIDPNQLAGLQKSLGYIKELVVEGAKPLGLGQSTINKVGQVTLDLGEINFKDANVGEVLAAAFGKAGSQMIEAIAPSLDQFVLGGEGMLQTLLRVGGGIDEATSLLDKLGIASIKYTDISKKHGDVAAEMVRQSLVDSETSTAKTFVKIGNTYGGFSGWFSSVVSSTLVFFETETVSSLGKIMESAQGSAQELAELYSGLVHVRTAFIALGFSGEAVSASLLKGAGGLDALQSGLDDFQSGFLTTAEQMSVQQALMDAEFKKIGMTTPATSAAFKDLVLGLRAGGEASAETLGKVLVLSGGMHDLTQAADDAAAALKETNQGWQDQLDVLLGTQTERSIALRDATDESTRALMRQVYAQQDAKTAQEGYTQALSSAQTRFDSAKSALASAQSAMDAVRSQATDAYVSAQDKVAAAQQRIADIQANAIKATEQAAIDAAQKMRDLGKTLREFVDGQVKTPDQAFAATLQKALAGDQEAMGNLTGAAQSASALAAERSGNVALTQARIMADVMRVAVLGEGTTLPARSTATPDDMLAAQNDLLAAQRAQTDALNVANTIGASTSKAVTDLLAQYTAAQATANIAQAEFDAAKKVLEDIKNNTWQTYDGVAKLGNALTIELTASATSEITKLIKVIGDGSGLAPDLKALALSLPETITKTIKTVGDSTSITELQKQLALMTTSSSIKTIELAVASTTITAEQKKLALMQSESTLKTINAMIGGNWLTGDNLTLALATSNSVTKTINAALGSGNADALRLALVNSDSVYRTLYASISGSLTPDQRAVLNAATGASNVNAWVDGDVTYTPDALTASKFDEFRKFDTMLLYLYSIANATALLAWKTQNPTGDINPGLTTASDLMLKWQAEGRFNVLQAVPKFASGGVFTNSIVSRPTNFSMAQMGEAGPEAIMPLANINGSLGVRFAGNSSNDALVAEIRRLRESNERLERRLQAIESNTNATAVHTANTADSTRRMDAQGVLIYTDPKEPIATKAAA